ncbi:MAG: hypothetical protein HKP61_13860 [Dactylosporangium sp.]|nr:hypothetical protein [Dactylosporangium sp.]NNJ61999.1 hypothetical protein [Dactylosporangium sp.]
MPEPNQTVVATRPARPVLAEPAPRRGLEHPVLRRHRTPTTPGPHAHFAIRGTIPRTILKQVIAATYRQIWWPATNTIAYPNHHQPVWDDQARAYIDPHTRQPLPTWAEALDTIDDNQGDHDNQGDAEPVHVVRFGQQTDIKGVLGGTPEADTLIGYLTKYLTKTVDACHTTTTDRQAAHLDRLWHELRYTPCSPRCPN